MTKTVAITSRGRLACGSALAVVMVAATANAQPAPDAASGAPSAGPNAASGSTRLDGVTVIGERPEAYTSETFPTLFKLTQPNLDTPTITPTITHQVIEDRGELSLNDIFRNASGISLGAGESSWQGTNLTLRGFNARNDLFLDGMRDFGSYYRDAFDLEEVEVLQGPSSFLFGRGSTGGRSTRSPRRPRLRPTSGRKRTSAPTTPAAARSISTSPSRS